MKHAEFMERSSFTKDELLAAGWGSLIKDVDPLLLPSLPAPPFLMFDRIVHVSKDGGKGKIVAEQDISRDAWYFQCHFRMDPVQPGCLGVDAVWQLLGFYAFWRGARGSGRALGSKEIDFFGQIRPYDKLVTYDVDIRRYTYLQESETGLVIGDAKVIVDGEEVYKIKGAKAGIFKGIKYPDYPHPSENSKGGRLST